MDADLRRDGYALRRNVLEQQLPSIANLLGTIRTDLRNPAFIREIRPEPLSSANPNTLSSRHGMGAFPFHTDCAHWEAPAKYLVLYCAAPGSGGRPTLIIDSYRWRWSQSQKRALCNEVWSRALKRPSLCTIAEETAQGLSLRFDDACMRPMTRAAAAVGDAVRKQIVRSTSLSILWKAGDCLVLDNHRILHARGNSPRADRDRSLKRILIGGGNESVGLQGLLA